MYYNRFYFKINDFTTEIHLSRTKNKYKLKFTD
nr:MAG TPA: hypothetical protein [Caudoviricetes sp.]